MLIGAMAGRCARPLDNSSPFARGGCARRDSRVGLGGGHDVSQTHRRLLVREELDHEHMPVAAYGTCSSDVR